MFNYILLCRLLHVEDRPRGVTGTGRQLLSAEELLRKELGADQLLKE